MLATIKTLYATLKNNHLTSMMIIRIITKTDKQNKQKNDDKGNLNNKPNYDYKPFQITTFI